MEGMDKVNDAIIKAQEEQIEILKGLVSTYKNTLIEIESQLNDRGGFDILRASINEMLK
tara:strand:- start:741 stop:917 length:177 start_codon:yes stop_codon:yes gene_type:complete